MDRRVRLISRLVNMAAAASFLSIWAGGGLAGMAPEGGAKGSEPIPTLSHDKRRGHSSNFN